MAQFVNLNPGSLRELHIGNERLVSYNVEMTEVTGGDLSDGLSDLGKRCGEGAAGKGIPRRRADGQPVLPDERAV